MPVGILLLALLLLPSVAPGEEGDVPPGRGVLTFGLTPFLSFDEMREGFGPIVKHLGRETGCRFRMVYAPDYVSVGEDLRDGYIDVAWLAPFAYVAAKEKAPGLTIIATLTEDGRSFYRGFIIARRAGGVGSIEDFEGKVFSFVGKASTSGYVFPMAMFKERGIDPGSFFSKVLFLGNHDNVIDSVYFKRSDGGATYDAAYRGSRRRGIDLDALKVVAKTGPIPQDAICARPGLPPSLVGKIREALLGVNRREEVFRIKGYGRIGFAPGRDHAYDIVRRAAAHGLSRE